MPVVEQISLPFGLPPVALIAIVAVAFLLATTLGKRRRSGNRQEGYAAFLASTSDWASTTEPCGLGVDDLEVLPFTPSGVGERGVEFGVEGPLPVEVGSRSATVPAATFVWWRQERGDHATGSTSRLTDRRDVVGVARLPVGSRGWFQVEPQNMIRRRMAGTRLSTDQPVGSEAFQHAFAVTGPDSEAAAVLFDPAFQQFLLERFVGRTILFSQDLLVLPADPDQRDDALVGPAALLAGVREDLRILVSGIPAAYWELPDRDPVSLRAQRDGGPGAGSDGGSDAGTSG